MIKVAILGFGTVGSGVAEVLKANRAEIRKAVGDDVELKYIVDVRDFPDSEFSSLVTHDFSDVENDREVSVVAETIGGATVAYDFTKRALLAGKSVVSSNKELVAAKGAELLEIAEKKGVSYLFEASVGGGIPVLRPLSRCLAGNEILEVRGILNGTTNYILTQMIKNSKTFAEALSEAQALGYAEKDPTADVEGIDACRKICILTDLAFGRELEPDTVPTEGISKISLTDVAIAGKAGYKIKLLGRCVKTFGGVCAYVAPHLVPASELLSGVDDVFNAIEIVGNAVGKTLFFGAGAGKMPTASAVVGDIIDACQHAGSPRPLGWVKAEQGFFVDATELESRFYVRGTDAPAGSEMLADGAFITPKMSLSGLKAKLSGKPYDALFRVLD